jgi:lipopolysaccharide export LptBFGC system permease protein LptF
MDLYVARQFLGAYGVSFVSFVGLYILIEAFSKLDRFLRQDSSLLVSLFKYHLAMIPTVYANYLGPILTLSAAMFTMATLNRRNELTPLKMAGISIYRVLLPIFFFAICLTGFSFYLKDQLIPRFKDPIRAALSLGRAGQLRPLPYFDDKEGYQIRVREYSPTSKIGHRIQVSRLHAGGKVKMIIDADLMEWVPASPEDSDDGEWILHDGSIQRLDTAGNLIENERASDFARLKEPFKRMRLATTLRPIDLETSDPEISYLSWRDLKSQYQRQPYHRHLAVKLHQHFSFPLAHLVLLFLGLPFVLNTGSKSPFLSLVASFFICALFFIVNYYCMSIASNSDFLGPIFWAWLPVMVFGSVGIALFDKLPT